GITYRAEDLARGTQAIVNELAPTGSERMPNGDIDFRGIGPEQGLRLRHQFTREARTLQRIRIPRVPQYRSVFHQHQTAYYATDLIAGAVPLTEVIGDDRLEADFVQRLLEMLLETLDSVHRQGMLHLDVRPSNILLGPRDEPFLVDFGQARQWHSDLTEKTSSDYAPLEQVTEGGRRSAATDLYSLGATIYTLLTGSAPTSPEARLSGVPLIAVSSVRPDVSDALAQATTWMLEVYPEARPQSAQEVLKMLQADDADKEDGDRIRELDAKRRRLQQFRFDPMQCPSCGEVMVSPQPLGHDVCPVCQEGKIRKRKIADRTCPSCSGGVLVEVANTGPLRYCPNCNMGRMRERRKFYRPTGQYVCDTCDFLLCDRGGTAIDGEGEQKSWDEWREQSGRSTRVVVCDTCDAQFDVQRDGRWLRKTDDLQGDGWTRLYPEEWAKVAAGLAPDAGNADCDACGADFFMDKRSITLLDDPVNDPYGFAGHYAGELLSVRQLPFVAVGKESGRPGLVCKSCGTEFDEHGGKYRLVRSANRNFRSQIGEAYSLHDWHRMAQDLPKTGEEETIEADMASAVRAAYVSGEIDFDPRTPDVVWRGEAREEGKRPKRLVVFKDSIVFGGLWGRRVEPMQDVLTVHEDGGTVVLTLVEGEDWNLHVAPVTMTVRLASGNATAHLCGRELAERISALRARASSGV
ncbi:MAG TPA: protein kinase, partial [Fimbriimonadaceae bacterium]|nr:protein kinase [Fimbriimonadaceae bacterium]